MEPDRLDFLLGQLVADGPRGPLSPECFGIERILAILESPASTEPAEVQHLIQCPACQRAFCLARRERLLIEAPLESEEAGPTPNPAPDGRKPVGPARVASGSRTIKSFPRLLRLPVACGIAAALLITVGISLWANHNRQVPTPQMLGAINGGFDTDGTRASSGPEYYTAYVALKADAYVVFIYLDSSRNLKLPKATQPMATRFRAGQQAQHEVSIKDDPPGRRWLVAVASSKDFDPVALRDRLQTAIIGLPADAPIDDLIARLEKRLREFGGFEFRSFTFDVPVGDTH